MQLACIFVKVLIILFFIGFTHLKKKRPCSHAWKSITQAILWWVRCLILAKRLCKNFFTHGIRVTVPEFIKNLETSSCICMCISKKLDLRQDVQAVGLSHRVALPKTESLKMTGSGVHDGLVHFPSAAVLQKGWGWILPSAVVLKQTWCLARLDTARWFTHAWAV